MPIIAVHMSIQGFLTLPCQTGQQMCTCMACHATEECPCPCCCPHSQALAAAFSYSDTYLSGFSCSPADYAHANERLLAGRSVEAGDSAAVVTRVKELLQQVEAERGSI